MPGWLTNGMTQAAGDELSGTPLFPVDTQNASGETPQSVSYPVGWTLAAAGITAQADGTKANATELGYGISIVETVAGAADSVLLPPALSGAVCFIRNATATAMQVFGQGTDTVNGVATGTGVSQAANIGAVYFCGADGAWFTTALS